MEIVNYVRENTSFTSSLLFICNEIISSTSGLENAKDMIIYIVIKNSVTR